jgi:hypothetical protein
LADGRTVEAGGGPPTPLRVALELVTTDGQRALIPLDRYGTVPPPLAVRLVKPDVVTIGLPVDLTLRSPAEVVLQTYAVSIDDVMASQPGLRPERIESLAIRPLGPEAGALWVGEVGVTP